MKFKSFFVPSFEMAIQEFTPKSIIQLVGENNWWRLVGTYGLMVVVMIGFAIYYQTFFSLLPLIYGFYFFYQFVSAPTYIKEVITFDKNGILLQHSKDLNGSRRIKREAIHDVYIIRNRMGRLEFVLNDRKKKEFEFSINNSNSAQDVNFISGIEQLLDLKIDDQMRLRDGTVYHLVSQKKQSACILPLENKCLLFKVFIDREGGVLRIGKADNKDAVFQLSSRNQQLTYKNWYFAKKKIRFSDIVDFKQEVTMQSTKNSTNVIGRFYVVTKNKKIRLMSISINADKLPLLLQFKMRESLEQLKKIVLAEVGR